MINFIKLFLLVFIKQLFVLLVFTNLIGLEFKYIILVSILLLALYLMFYLKYFKNIYKKLKLPKGKGEIYYFLSWIIMGIVITCLIFNNTWLWNFLPTTSEMFSGIIYMLVPMLLGIYILILIGIKFIVWLSNYFKH